MARSVLTTCSDFALITITKFKAREGVPRATFTMMTLVIQIGQVLCRGKLFLIQITLDLSRQASPVSRPTRNTRILVLPPTRLGLALHRPTPQGITRPILILHPPTTQRIANPAIFRLRPITSLKIHLILVTVTILPRTRTTTPLLNPVTTRPGACHLERKDSY